MSAPAALEWQACAEDIPTVAGLSALAQNYDAILCDVWGVLIDGAKHFAAAADALRAYRAGGGTAVLITNASRPSQEVRRQLEHFGLPDDCYDDLISAGELTLREIVARNGAACHHLGPKRDIGLFESAGRQLGAPIRLVGPRDADYVVCTGLIDEDHETPEDYDSRLEELRRRDLVMLCANPDIVVERGDRLIYCAGAIAELYRELGGEVIFYGKPHRPIYERAMALATERRGHATALDRVLAIGDSVRTDLAGAHGFGIDCLFVTRGIHAEDFEGIDQLDPASVKELFGHPPRALTRELRW